MSYRSRNYQTKLQPNLSCYLCTYFRVEEVTSGIAPGTKVINGHIDKVEDFMFEIVDYADPYGVLNIECSATVHDMVIKKRDLSLKKESEQNSQSNSQSRPTTSNPGSNKILD